MRPRRKDQSLAEAAHILENQFLAVFKSKLQVDMGKSIQVGMRPDEEPAGHAQMDQQSGAVFHDKQEIFPLSFDGCHPSVRQPDFKIRKGGLLPEGFAASSNGRKSAAH